MIKITDTVKHILIINVLFFVAKYVATQNGVNLTQYLGLFFIKNELFMPWQFVSTMFMHASVNHILFNMLALWMFGSALEQVWGKTKFLFFYFSAGIGASLIYTLANLENTKPVCSNTDLISFKKVNSSFVTSIMTGNNNCWLTA